jgi:hypothetical protein
MNAENLLTQSKYLKNINKNFLQQLLISKLIWRVNNSRGQYYREDNKCYKCGEKGHIQKDCRERGRYLILFKKIDLVQIHTEEPPEEDQEAEIILEVTQDQTQEIKETKKNTALVQAEAEEIVEIIEANH